MTRQRSDAASGHGPGRSTRFLALLGLFCASAADARGPQSGAGFFSARAREVPLANSVEVLRDEESIFVGPSTRSSKRGVAARGARLPLFGARRGTGCSGRFWLVGPDAFICEDGARPSSDSAPPLDRAPSTSRAGLPHRYFFVSAEGSFGYAALETAEEGVPETQLQPGFGVALTRLSEKTRNDPFGLTTHGFWIPLRDLVEARDVAFEGSAWSDTLGWIVRDGTPVFSAPGKRSFGQVLPRLSSLSVLESQNLGRQRYLRFGDGAWIRSQDLRMPRRADPPRGLLPDERWLDVDLARQTLVAYVGNTPVFATLVSSGRGAKETESATPVGLFRIWVKLRTSDMDNLENSEAPEVYAIQAVPWVMFFERGYGLHGTFWHQRFGEVQSHGCVNLAPRDAERLFYFTGPRLLPGWTAVFPTARDPGTLVRVRAE